MKINNIHIEGYGVWSDLKVERFADSLNVIHGPNEAGKTTLLQFIRSVFYGYSPQRRRYLPPFHGGLPGGAIDVASPNGRFQIKRIYTENNGAPDEQLTLTAPDGVRQGEHFLKVLLSNVDEKVFNNVFAVGLREIQELNTLSDTDAAEMLYNLTVGMDRVSLVEVLKELEASRNRLIDAGGGHCLVLQLLADRAKMLAEIDDLASLNNRYARIAAEYATIDSEVARLEEEANRVEHQVEVMDLAAAVRNRWLRRAELDEQLDALGRRPDMPTNAVERLDSLNSRIEQRRKRMERLSRRREELRREFRSLKINDLLRRQTPRIEAVVEQEPWIARLQTEVGELETEIGRLDAQLAAEAGRLGLSGNYDAAIIQSSDAIRSLRAPAGEMQEARNRLNDAKRQAENARAAAESLSRELQSALTARGEHDLSAAMKRADDAVQLVRRRSQIDEQIDRYNEYLAELEERRRTLVDRQLPPGWLVFGLGAFFVLGAVLLLTGLFMPESFVGTTGLTLAILGGVGCAAAVFAKVMLERLNLRQLESCRIEIEQTKSQIAEAEKERDSFTARSNGDDRSSSGLRAAERELAALKELNPLAARRDAARTEAEAAEQLVDAAREAARATKRRWRQALNAAGLPDDVLPKQLSQLARNGGRIADMKRRLTERREELTCRRREFESLGVRVSQLAADAGLLPGATAGWSSTVSPGDMTSTAGQAGSGALFQQTVNQQVFNPQAFNSQVFNPLETLRSLADAASRQQTTVARREAIRRQSRRIRNAVAGYEESIGRLKHRRRQLLIESGVKSEEEFRRRALEYERQVSLRDQRDAIDREIEAALASRCSPEAVARQLDDDQSAALEQRRAETRQRAAAIREKLGGLLEHRGRLREQIDTLACDRRLAEKRLDLAVLETRLRDAVHRWRTQAVACRVLAAIRKTYEQDRQPETLREASGYLERLTGGRYRRVWTPLGESSLRIDDAEGRAMSVESLSRGTREQLFLALRLALASAYARRGAPLPLVLDDVLVNFDDDRAKAAVAVLRDFADAGHQMLVFTCHEHIYKLFKSLKTAVGLLSDNSEPGQLITLDADKTEVKPKQEKRPAPPRRKTPAKQSKPKSKQRSAAKIQVVEEKEDDESLDDESLWDEDNDDGYLDEDDENDIDGAALVAR